MKLSHILYKVDDLHQAVEDFKKMGFTVEYGTNPQKAYNAIIWFEKGPFIELFHAKPNKIINGILSLLGKKGLLSRTKLFQSASYGWIDYALENDRCDVEKETALLTSLGYEFSAAQGARKNIRGTKLKWKLLMPSDTTIPFLMSAYTPDPRPKTVNHPNGAKEVTRVIWGTTHDNITSIRRFSEDECLELVEGDGFQKIVIDGWDAEILNKAYYK